MQGQNTPPSCPKRFKIFFKAHWKGVFGVVLPLVCLPFIVGKDVKKYNFVAYCLIIMACFWVLEILPLPLVSFIPLAVYPLADVMPGANACACYLNDTIVVFLGSMMLAAAIEQSNLHSRIAVRSVQLIGYSHYRILFALSFTTCFVSMWLQNTAACTMMVPITFALLHVFEDQNLLKIFETNAAGDQEASEYTSIYFCAVSYAASIGGVGTLVGTGTNLVLRGLFESTYPTAPEYISFPLFSAFTVPFMLAAQATTYISMLLLFFGFLRPKSAAAKKAHISPEGVAAAKAAVAVKGKELGKLRLWEILTMILFGIAVLMFFGRSPQLFKGWGDLIDIYYTGKQRRFIRDSVVTTLMSFLMFVIPRNCGFFKTCTAKSKSQMSPGRIKSVLDWVLLDKDLPWSFMFLLGGGFAISTAASDKYTNLNGIIGDFLSKFSVLPNTLLLFIFILFGVGITNFASNVAVANVIVPIGMVTAQKIGVNPLTYNLAGGISASFAFMIPVGTPPNLIIQSAAKVTTKQMVKAGLIPSIAVVVYLWLFLMGWGPVVWSDLKKPLSELDWVNGSDTATTTTAATPTTASGP